jgi:hypothetical protein
MRLGSVAWGWLEIYETAGPADEGDTSEIAVAESLHARLLLIDERDGYRVTDSAYESPQTSCKRGMK